MDGLNAFVERFWSFTDAVGMPSLLIDEKSAVFNALGAREVPADAAEREGEAEVVALLRQANPSYSVDLEGHDSLLGGLVLVDPERGVLLQLLEEKVGRFLAGDGAELAQAIDECFTGGPAL